MGFLLLPLIENAIKHGMKTSKMPLTIVFEAALVNDNLNIAVINSGEWIENNASISECSGVGLHNVIQRLENAYPDRHSFDVIKQHDLVEVRLQIFDEHKSRNE